MTSVFRKFFLCIATLSMILALTGCTSSGTKQATGAVQAKYGQLQVIGTQLCDAQGKPVQLKGMSTMGLQWYGGIVNKAAFTALVKDWECDVIRLALYVGENGYATDPSLKNLVIKGVELAAELGVYVIIDWHVLTPGNPNDPVYRGAQAFFDEMSAKFGNYPHVIYEIMNEPNGAVSWERDLKPYAEKMVATIRANDPDNIILIGSGTWSQDVDEAAADPVAGENLMYTFHFYSGSHGNTHRNKVQVAIDRGAAVFCSEWGTSASNGTGGPFLDGAEEWLKFMDDRQISWVNWSLCNKNETSAAFKALLQEFIPGKGTVITQKQTPLEPKLMGPDGYPVWTIKQLSESGNFIRAKIKGIEVPVPSDKTIIRLWDFEKGRSGWAVASDSSVSPDLTTGTAQSSALMFKYGWSATAADDGWTTAPRLKIADTNLAISSATALDFDVYLEAGKQVATEFEITPVLQYPPTWWKQLPGVKLNYASGKEIGNGLLKYPVSVPVSVDKGTTLAHLLLVVSGNGTGYDGAVYIDNIAFTALDSDAETEVVDAGTQAAEPEEALPAAELGSYNGLPWNFEDGTLQGWTLADDTPARVILTNIAAESKALAFAYGWTLPTPSDSWSVAPRISSSWVSLAAKDYKNLKLDFYIQASKAKKGSIMVQPIIQSPQHGYWFQMKSKEAKFSEGRPSKNGLLKFSFTFPLVNNAGAGFKPDAIMRNLILITVGQDTDYSGIIYYDNITFE